jgi:simple sugar transport system ATP-binding protein
MEQQTEKSDKVFVRFENVNKWYGGVHALKDVSAEIRSGEALGIVGDNGAGKSTLVKALTGAVTIDSGTIYVKDRIVHFRHPKDSQREGIHAIYQDLSLVGTFDLAANVYLGQEVTKPLAGVMPLLDKSSMLEEAMRILRDELNISVDNPYQAVRNLSGGQQQAVAISRALLAKAQLILMDEPTAAMGVEETEQILSLVENLKQQFAVVVVSHNLEEVLRVCDRLLVMRGGQIVGDLNRDETDKNELVSLITGLR